MMTVGVSPAERKIQTPDGLELRVLSWSAESPRACAVVVHGLGEHAGRYGHVARALNQGGISVLGYDQRGHGASQGPRGHASQFKALLNDLDLVWAAASRQCGGRPMTLLGHSMGGLVALAWAQTRKPRLAGLVASAPWLGTVESVPGWKRALARVVDRLYPSFTLPTGTSAERVTSDPEMIAAREADPLVHSRLSPRLFHEAEYWQDRVNAEPGRLKADCLFIVPGADDLTDASATLAFARALPAEHTTVMKLPGFRHEAFNERGREAVISDVKEWIAARSS
jgi:alpha-beta hydrolase superfamily lysophospholipase